MKQSKQKNIYVAMLLIFTYAIVRLLLRIRKLKKS